ncbi:MAG: YeeE/YedE family protein [Candidatus Thorarchaeota archaeon]
MQIDIINALIPGLIVGILFGLALQRGRFCMYSAFRDPLMLKEYKLLWAVFLAILVEMVGFAIMHYFGIIALNPKPLVWGAQILGGFIFGIGMGFAGGCASGTTYRVGEGMMGSLVALIGLAIGAYLAKIGVLAAWVAQLQADTLINFPDDTALTLGGEYNWMLMLGIGIVGLALMFWKFVLPAMKTETISFGEIFKKGWPWWMTGIVIGFIGIIAFVSSAAAGRNYPLGITAGWLGILNFIIGGTTTIGWLSWMVIGIVIGAFIFSFYAGEWKIRIPKDPKKIVLQFIGGLMMGIGAVMALGCNIGNILSGWPQLSVGSIVTGVFIILGAWVITYILFMRDAE